VAVQRPLQAVGKIPAGMEVQVAVVDKDVVALPPVGQAKAAETGLVAAEEDAAAAAVVVDVVDVVAAAQVGAVAVAKAAGAAEAAEAAAVAMDMVAEALDMVLAAGMEAKDVAATTRAGMAKAAVAAAAAIMGGAVVVLGVVVDQVAEEVAVAAAAMGPAMGVATDLRLVPVGEVEAKAGEATAAVVEDGRVAEVEAMAHTMAKVVAGAAEEVAAGAVAVVVAVVAVVGMADGDDARLPAEGCVLLELGLAVDQVSQSVSSRVLSPNVASHTKTDQPTKQ